MLCLSTFTCEGGSSEINEGLEMDQAVPRVLTQCLIIMDYLLKKILQI